MTALQWTWVVAVGAGLLCWLAQATMAFRARGALVWLERTSPPEPARWPRLSMIIPACDEAQTLEAAMRSKLAQDYPDLELILVDDRSTDGTGALVDRLAGQDDRIRPLHVTELPEGWLGKVHALAQGAGLATGEWLLFTDADVHLGPGAVRRAIAYCEHMGLDHLGLIPHVSPGGLLLDVTMSVFGRMVVIMGRPWAVRDRRSRVGAGVGAFNLVRRSALERSPGLEWIKLDVADDAALGAMLKRAGASCEVGLGRGLVGVRIWPTLRDLMRAMEKSAVGLEFSLLRAVGVTLAILWLELAPFLGLLPLGVPWLQLASAAVAVLSIGVTAMLNRAAGQRLGPSLLSPLGVLVIAAFLLRAGVLGWRRRSVSWRGTAYPARALLEGRRFRVV